MKHAEMTADSKSPASAPPAKATNTATHEKPAIGGTPEQAARRLAPRAALSALAPLAPYAFRYKGRIAAATVALLVASMATLVVPVAVRRMIDLGFTEKGVGMVDAYFGVMILVVGVLAMASAARYYLVMTIGERIVADVRTAVFAHLTRLDPGFFDTIRSGEIVSRLTADTTLVKSAFGASASVFLRNLVLFAGAATMMVVSSPWLSGLVSLAIPFIILPLIASGRSVRRRTRDSQDRLADASAYAAEQIGAVRTMQAFGAERWTAARFEAASEAAFTAAQRSTLSRAILTAVAIFLVSASVVGVLWVGAQDVLEQRMTAGRLSQFVLYAVFAASSLGQLGQVWGEVSGAAGAAERLAELLRTPAAIASPAHPAPLPQPPRGSVAFENVSFNYPNSPETMALSGISFSVAPGERVAIVGPSGAGKSTVLQLILRFYDATSGRILVDGVPVPSAHLDELRARIALVPQEPAIFAATIAENIRYGCPDATDAQVRRAAALAAAEGFIDAAPQGFETPVGERGVTLSGGQKQRLAIARAILKDAPILLLDEATSALDAESETLVQHALDTLMQGRTTLVIAHRLATVLSADRILVIDAGRIVEDGTHDALVARGGLYARLARLQFEAGAQAWAAAREPAGAATL